MSTITGNVVLDAAARRPDIPGHIIASALAIIAGAIVCFLGLARLGWLVEFISLTSISAFMTGSALNIAVGQVPTMMGITGFSTRDATYKVFINTLKHLGRSQLDAAMGLTALAMLYLIRSLFTYLGNRIPAHRRLFFFISTLRTVFVILLYTLISWLVNMHIKDHKSANAKFKILGTVPRGFQHAAVPQVDSDIISIFASELPASVIVLLIEHISIAKSFGRVNGYTIDPSQELVAIGVTNLLGPFLGGYPATGSFSRTAIKSKAGVRTPLAGLITAIVVLLAIYALPAVFFYIPNATLSAVIIHAVGDLITPPNTVYQFWKISPLEVFIFFAGVIVTVFTTIEIGVYVTVAVSAALLLFRVFKARGRFLGRVKVHSVIGDHLLTDTEGKYRDDPDRSARNIYIPIDHNDGSNPQIEVEAPYPGVFIYRFSEGYNYPNANHYLDYMVEKIFQQTRRTNPNAYNRKGVSDTPTLTIPSTNPLSQDRPWNDPGPRKGEEINTEKPTLKAIILDFSSVNNVDITSVQHLIDVRNQLDRYASPDTVQWHFACINNRWTKRALASAGFGYLTPDHLDGSIQRWKPVFSVAELGGSASAAADAEFYLNKEGLKRQRTLDLERARSAGGTIQHEAEEIMAEDSDDTRNSVEKAPNKTRAYGSGKIAVVHGLNRPLFHIDLTSALHSAIANIESHTSQGTNPNPEPNVILGTGKTIKEDPDPAFEP